MAFTSALSYDSTGTLSGEIKDIYSKTVLSSVTFEDGLNVGRFAKLDTGSIDNLDASTTPVIAGVVKRSVTNAVEDGDTYTADNCNEIEYVRSGLVTVEVKSGQTPSAFGAVYAYNVADADAGKVTTSATSSVATNAEFISEVSATVWVIRLK